MNTPTDDVAHVVVAGSLPPRSSCCNEELRVTREVHDTVSYAAEGYDPETRTLDVRYLKVYEGDADSFYVSCSACDTEVDCEVEEI